MTDEVAEQVLRNNYLQTQAISLLEADAVERIREHQYLIRVLEREAGLDRALEFLPRGEEIDERRKANKGLTRPELAVLLSYGKMALYRDMIASSVPEDRYLSRELAAYFPAPLRRRYEDLMAGHRLAREIIATALTNSLVNRMGPVFAYRTRDETGADMASVARAYTIAREVFNVRALWQAIENLDSQVHANTQYSMMSRTTRLLKHGTHWFLDRPALIDDIAAAVQRFGPAARKLVVGTAEYLTGREYKRFEDARVLYADIGIPDDVARVMAGLHSLHSALDIIEVAEHTDADVLFVAAIYFRLGESLEVDWLRDQVERLTVEGRWQAMARNSMRENLYFLQGQITQQVLDVAGRQPPDKALANWSEARADRLIHVHDTISEMRTQGQMDFATLGVALQEIRRLTQV